MVEEDPVANFVVLPNYNEDEPMFRDTLRSGADVYLLPKQLDEQVAKLQFRASSLGTRARGPCQGAGESFGFSRGIMVR